MNCVVLCSHSTEGVLVLLEWGSSYHVSQSYLTEQPSCWQTCCCILRTLFWAGFLLAVLLHKFFLSLLHMTFPLYLVYFIFLGLEKLELSYYKWTVHALECAVAGSPAYMVEWFGEGFLCFSNVPLKNVHNDFIENVLISLTLCFYIKKICKISFWQTRVYWHISSLGDI